MRSSGDRRVRIWRWVWCVALAGCNLGERGGEGPAKQAAAPAPAVVEVALVAELAPGSCEATAAKLVELSLIEGKAIGREWSPDKQTKKRE